MPSRIVQTLCSTLFVLTLLCIDKTTTDSLWLLIPTGFLVAASFTLGALINSYWYSRFPPKLITYEKNWVRRFVPFFDQLSPPEQEDFFNKLAFELAEKEFISMAEKDLPEELKMMALVPAVRLNLIHSNTEAKHYSRIIFYHHSFASPEQQYIHLSETHHEDGALVFASDALEAAYLKPDQYLNIALYEWCRVFVVLNKIEQQIDIKSSDAWPHINSLLSTETDKIIRYLGQPDADHLALLCYSYVTFPKEMEKRMPEFYQMMKSIIQ
jgi:hypothetical protein